MENKTTMSAPWILYYREVEALFAEDPDVKVIFDEDAYALKLYVDGNDKAEAISCLLPNSKEFGNIKMTISIIPANVRFGSAVDAFRKAFEGNPAVTQIKTVSTPFGEMNFVVFKNKVVQYFDDDISDFYGVHSTLYQEIAKDILMTGNQINYCTDVPVTMQAAKE